LITGKQNHLFIISWPRSGSTVLYRLLAYHPNSVWFSKFSLKERFLKNQNNFSWDKIGRKFFKHRYSKNNHMNFIERLYTAFVPTPIENQKIWDECILGEVKNEKYLKNYLEKFKNYFNYSLKPLY